MLYITRSTSAAEHPLEERVMNCPLYVYLHKKSITLAEGCLVQLGLAFAIQCASYDGDSEV